MLVALQRGIPVDRYPFAALGRTLGKRADELVAAVAEARRRGLVRRFGAVFDTRRLGYRSALCALAAPAAEADRLAARVTPFAGVTHCYLREAADRPGAAPNLWFTLSAPTDGFDRAAEDVRAAVAPCDFAVLPAVRRYKIDVVFGGATRDRDESPADDLPPPDALERRIIAALQGDTEVREDYFAALAEKLGVSEWDLLSRLEIWRRNGRLKRIGLLLNHREAGFTANGMCCWRIAGDTRAAGRALAADARVTHCYERPEAPAFPYNLFAMIHCRARAEADGVFAALSALPELAGAPRTMLVSTREYKKTSMTFFV